MKPADSKILLVCCLFLILNFFGLYGALFSAFYPSEKIEIVAGWISLSLFVLFLTYVIFLLFKNRPSVKARFIGYRFFVFTFGAVPLLIGYVALLLFFSVSRGIPDLICISFVEEKLVIVKVYDKRVWGKHDNRYEFYISGYDGGVPVSKSVYSSVEKGQDIEAYVSHSPLGRRFRF